MIASCKTRHEYHAQHGAALMVMLVIMVIGAAAFLVSSLNRSTLRIQQDQNSSQILAQAKEEVIGYTLQGQPNIPPGRMQPPDVLNEPMSTELRPDGTQGSNYDGEWEFGCFNINNASNTPPYTPLTITPANMRCLGRLPWKSFGMSISNPSENDPLGIMPWYAFSSNLLNASLPLNSELTNVSTNWLTVHDMNGNVRSDRVAVVIIVPGTALPGKSRSSSPLGGPDQYLDSIGLPAGCNPNPPTPTCSTIYNNAGANNEFIMGDEHRWITDPNNPANQIEDSNYQFNDKLIYITRDELMPLIEKRVGNEIKKTLNTYYAAWGAFPFAAPFTNPSTSNFTGQAATYAGLLPILSNVMPTWAGIPTVSFSGGGSYNLCELRTGSTTDSRWRCKDIAISAGETITITGTLNNVGLGFWRTHNIKDTNEVRARDSGGNTVLATSVLDNVSVTGSLNPDGSATVVFSAKGKAGFPTIQRIELRDIRGYTTAIAPATSPVIPTWLVGENWHQLAYYAVAQGYAPGGNHTCSSPCLTVNGLGGGSNKQAVVVMTSGALSGQTHPSATLTNYLEGENAIPDSIYENQTHSSTFNDQVIVVAP